MFNVIPTRRQRLPGALWVGLALIVLAVVVMVASYNRERAVQHAAWLQGYDQARAEVLTTVADAYRAGLAEGVAQVATCDATAPQVVLRAGCCGVRP